MATLTLGPALAGRGIAKFPADAADSRASHYANMKPKRCLAELERRKIPFTVVEEARGVLVPVRLTGPIGTVLFRTDFPAERRQSVPWEIFDCRLVLALDDFAKLLRVHDIEEVRIFSAYRPPSKKWPKGKVARRHPGGLAVDIRLLRKRGGKKLVVTDHFNGRIGAETCGPGAVAPDPATQEARELRSIVCEAADARLFHSILTPNYDRPHFNHFHLEVTAGVRWFIVR